MTDRVQYINATSLLQTVNYELEYRNARAKARGRVRVAFGFVFNLLTLIALASRSQQQHQAFRITRDDHVTRRNTSFRPRYR